MSLGRPASGCLPVFFPAVKIKKGDAPATKTRRPRLFWG
jgi:hypothetical protein